MKRFKLILVISTILFHTSYGIVEAQLQGQALIDSLLKEIPKAKQDTNHVNILSNLSFQYRVINPDEGIKYGEQGLKLAKKLSWKEGEANCYNSLGVNYSFGKSDYPKAIEYYQKALKINEEMGRKSGVASNLGNMGNIYSTQSDYPKALEYFHKALKIFKELENESAIASTLGNIGIIYEKQSDYPKALEYFQKALKINEEMGRKSGVASNLGNIGNIYKNQSDYPKALGYFHKALKINEELVNKFGVANNLGNIGIIYQNQSDYPKALEYYHNAIKIFEEMGNKDGVAANLGNIGLIYSSLSDYPKALDYYHKSMKIDEELGNKSGIASNLGNIGIIYMNQSDYPKALEYYNKALKINEEMGNKSGIANNLINMGSAYSQKGELDKSLEYLKKGFKLNIEIQNHRQTAFTLNMLSGNYINQAKMYDSLRMIGESKDYLVESKIKNSYQSALQFAKEAEHLADSIGLTELQPKIFHDLYESYKKLKEPAKALEYLEKYTELNDSIFSMEKTKEIATLEAKKEKEVAEKENIILKTEKKAHQFQSYLLVGGIVVLFGAFGVAFIRFREKKKLSDKLALQNTEIENQKRIVEEQKEILQEKNTEIIDSINYASTIQHALLPWTSVLANNFNEHFVFYKPKDIVSGDSYWFQVVDGIKYLAVIDCTGHGVPGSMLTVIANSVLDDAVLSKKLTSTSEILTYMNDKVTEVLNQRLAENSIRDGMEVALIAIHEDKIQFSGAGRPLYVKNGTFETLKTDKRGIAGQNDNDTYNFSSLEIEKTDNLMLYLTSDGFADQMNENSKKYASKRFVETLERISTMPLNQQKEILENEFNSHKGNREQIDDVTVIGVRI